MTTKFALLSYSTNNLGDEIQSIAVRQFLPSVDALVDRDDWSIDQPDVNGIFNIVLNGWFTHRPDRWPPPDWLFPLPISMHISRERLRQTTLSASEALLKGDGLRFIKHHEPIGGRDLWTVDLLRTHGVKAYFSGCVTLTLGPDRGRTRGNYICAVDLDDELHRCLTEHAQTPVWRLSHRDKSGGSFQQRCALAGRLLSIYAHAKCVVTTRLHCAMPSLALGTPILFINRAADQSRFGGLIDLVRSCSAESFISREVEFNFDNPTANSDAYLPLRENLIASLQAFTGASRRAFAVDSLHHIGAGSDIPSFA